MKASRGLTATVARPLIVTRHQHPKPTIRYAKAPHFTKEDTPPIRERQINMARGKGQQTSGGTKKEKKETRQERRARLEAEAAAREVSEIVL